MFRKNIKKRLQQIKDTSPIADKDAALKIAKDTTKKQKIYKHVRGKEKAPV